MISRLLTALVIALALGAASARAQTPDQPPMTTEQAAMLKHMEQLNSSLHPRTGAIPINEAGVTLNLGETYYFLDAADARRVLVEGWGNPPESVNGVLGMIFPAGKTFIDPVWGAVLTWSSDGYVSDHDAADIDYAKLLTELRQGEEEENKARSQAGYPSTHLVGWAQQPSYDATNHTLVWAKEISFSDLPDAHTLNYDIRVLGRHGVFSMNMVTGISDLEATRTAANELRHTVKFKPGAQYGDFKEGDKKAAYGVAGLIAGGAALAVAKKVGLLGILLLVLKKGAVFILAGLGAAGAWFRNLLGGRKGGEFGDANRRASSPAPMDSEPDPGLAPIIQPDEPKNPDREL